MKEIIIRFFCALIISAAFSIAYNIPIKYLFLAAVCGGVGYVCFYLVEKALGTVEANFFAACCISILAEIMARIFKTPAISFSIAALIPLVPGGGMYFTMLALIRGNFQEGAMRAYETLTAAGAIVIGILVVTSFVKLIPKARRKRL